MKTNNKYIVRYGSITEPKSEGGIMRCTTTGIGLVQSFESYESWNSQNRSEECRDNRESIRESIYQQLYNIDKSLSLQRNNYQFLIDKGVPKEQIEYDEEEILKTIEDLWKIRNRKSFETDETGKNVKDEILYKDSQGDDIITVGDTEYMIDRIFYGYIYDEGIETGEDGSYYDKIDEEEMVNMIMEELMGHTSFCGSSSDDSLDRLRDYVIDQVNDYVRTEVQ